VSLNPSNPFGPGFQQTKANAVSTPSSPPKADLPQQAQTQTIPIQTFTPGNPFGTLPSAKPVIDTSLYTNNNSSTGSVSTKNGGVGAPSSPIAESVASPSLDVKASPIATNTILEEPSAYPQAYAKTSEEDEYSNLGAGAISRLLKEWGVTYDRREVVEKADLLNLLRKHAQSRSTSLNGEGGKNNIEGRGWLESPASSREKDSDGELLAMKMRFEEEIANRKKKLEEEKESDAQREKLRLEEVELQRKKEEADQIAAKEAEARRAQQKKIEEEEEEEEEKKRFAAAAAAAAAEKEEIQKRKAAEEERLREFERVAKEQEQQKQKEEAARLAKIEEEKEVARRLLEEQQRADALAEEEKARAEALANSKAEAMKLKAEAAAAREQLASQQRAKEAAAAAAAEQARAAKEAAAAAEAEAIAAAAAAAQAEYEASLPLAEGWCEAYDAEGKVYYFHEKSRISRWTRPTGDAAAAISQRLFEQEAEAQRRHAERLADIQQREAEAANERAQSDSLKVSIRATIDKWSTKAGWLGLKVVRRSIRASASNAKAVECVSLVPRRCIISLLSTLHEVVPRLTGDAVVLEKPLSNNHVDDSILSHRPDYYVTDPHALSVAIAASTAISDGVLRRSFLNALRMLHPDKTSDETLETRLTAEMLYTTLTEVNGAMQDAKNGTLLATGGVVGETEL
jgi:hypothetical protein